MAAVQSASVAGGPFLSVGGPGTTYPVERFGGDVGQAINAAGAQLKSARGGTVYLVGGPGTVYTVRTPVVFLNTVNYVGDGVTLKAAPGVRDPFVTDPTNAYYSGYIASLTLDGGDVAGTTVLTCLSMQYSTFVDVVVQGADAPLTNLPAARSPTVWKNPSTTGAAYVQVVGGKVATVSVNGAPTGNTSGVFYIPPIGEISVTWSVAPTVNVANGLGVLLAARSSVAAPPETNKQNNAGNAFVSLMIRNCSVGIALAGALQSGQITDNTFSEFVAAFCNVCAVAYVNNADSNTWLQTQLKINAPGAVAVAFNLLTPTDDTQTYYNRHFALSVDTSNSDGQIGVLLNGNTSRPNFILFYQPNPNVPNPVVCNNRSRAYLYDVSNKVKHTFFGNRTGLAWHAEKYPGSDQPFVNPTPFSMLLLVQGGAVSVIRLNGQPLGISGGLIPLKAGDTVVCTSSADPSTFATLLSGI